MRKILPEFPQRETLIMRFRIFLIALVIISLCSMILVQAMYFYFRVPVALGEPAEIYGFLYAEAFFASAGLLCIILYIFIFLIRLVHYLQGYDIPTDKDIANAGLNPQADYTKMLVKESNYSHGTVLLGVLSLIHVIIFMIQWILGKLWNWQQLAILLPIAILLPFVIAYLIRRHNRKFKIERIKIMNKLEGIEK